jgi:hypothetical protein
VRGVGIVKLRADQVLARAPVPCWSTSCRRAASSACPSRDETLLEITLPRLALAPFEASAVAKLRLALARTAHA